MKQVHWTLPFGNIDGTKNYRIDIYDDPARSADGGQSWPVQLVGAATPFVTDEDNSDNFFTPVRSQTGVISIVNTSGELSIYDILPADNTDKPVRVVRVNDGAVVWQGFLNAETYTQGYNDRPQQIDINVNSMLAAMDSALVPDTMVGILKVRQALYQAIESMSNVEGIGHMITSVQFPYESGDIMSKFIDVSTFFDVKAQENEASISYDVVGISLRDVVSRICSFMGWTVREEGTCLYFELPKKGADVYKSSFTNLGRINEIQYKGSLIKIPHTNVDMAELKYKGDGHNISTRQGAKSVEIVAKAEPYNDSIKLHECRDADLVHKTSSISDGVISAYIDRGTGAISICEHTMYRAWLSDADKFERLDAGTKTPDECIDTSAFSSHAIDTISSGDYVYMRKNVGSMFSRIGTADTLENIDSYSSGLLVFGLMNQSNHSIQVSQNGKGINGDQVFRMWTPKWVSLKPGFLKIESSAKMYSGIDNFAFGGLDRAVCMYLKVGDKYYHPYPTYSSTQGDYWDENYGTFDVYYEGGSITRVGAKKCKITIPEYMYGFMEIGIFPTTIHYDKVSQTFNHLEMFITSLTVSYMKDESKYTNDGGNNTYYRLLGGNFSEDVSVNTELASIRNNTQSPYIMMDSVSKDLTTLPYKVGETTEQRRPEHDLLNRMADYYKSPRRIVSLEVERPDVELPTAQITGYDGKTYLPLSESRDWRTGVSTIQCFEVPE